MRRSLLLPLIVSCALFIEQMDSTVLSTSLPLIATDLGVDPIALKLALTSYLVSLAVFIPISGWIADRMGARRTFTAAIAVFLLGSILCAFSGSLAALVVSRSIQGIGGAMMVPVGRLVILRSIPRSDLVSALNYLTMPALIGPMLGPPLGGFITTYFHWRWIFLVNVPMGVVGIALARRFIPDLREEGTPPLDRLGFALSGVGLAAINAYFPDGVIVGNVLAGGQASRYPAGNFFPSVAQWMADFMDPAEGNYRLSPRSPYRKAARDGGDLGVNMDVLNRALSAPEQDQ